MTTEELLAKRYKVIADYPGSQFEVGAILEYINVPRQSGWYVVGDKKFDIYENGVEHYPHIFREMAWHEDRKVEDMPKYLKRHSGIEKVANWRLFYGQWKFDIKEGRKLFEDCSLTMGGTPATESEYLEYKKSKVTLLS